VIPGLSHSRDRIDAIGTEIEMISAKAGSANWALYGLARLQAVEEQGAHGVEFAAAGG
jgi:hypothetical protein